MNAQPYFSENVTKLWETATVFDMPESAFFDIENNAIYVASIGGKPSEKDENGFISKIEPNGNILKIDWIT